jgi:hypothetical protein
MMLDRIRLIAFLVLTVTITTVGFGILNGALGHDIWINRERRVNAQGEWCCNMHDCEVVAEDEVRENGKGFVLVASGEVVPYSEAQISGDHQYWRCKRPSGLTRCFFYPPPGS